MYVGCAVTDRWESKLTPTVAHCAFPKLSCEPPVPVVNPSVNNSNGNSIVNN